MYDLQNFLGDLQMTLVGLDKHLPDWKSPHDWKVKSSIELATFVISRAQRYWLISVTYQTSVSAQIHKPQTVLTNNYQL